MRLKDKEDLERVKPVSSGTSKNSSSSDPAEKRKNKRAGGNWKQSEGSLAAHHPKSLEEREGGKTKNKALNGSAASRAPVETLHATGQVTADTEKRPGFGPISA